MPVVDLRQQTSVTEGGYDITLQPARMEGDTAILPVLLENKGLKESYELWQVGFYAEDPEEGEILFCIAQASQSKNIPSEAESPGFSITWEFCFNTSNTVPFEVILNSAGLVNIESYEVHTRAINEVNNRVDQLNTDLSNLFLENGKHEFDIQWGAIMNNRIRAHVPILLRKNQKIQSVTATVGTDENAEIVSCRFDGITFLIQTTNTNAANKFGIAKITLSDI